MVTCIIEDFPAVDRSEMLTKSARNLLILKDGTTPIAGASLCDYYQGQRAFTLYSVEDDGRCNHHVVCACGPDNEQAVHNLLVSIAMVLVIIHCNEMVSNIETVVAEYVSMFF